MVSPARLMKMQVFYEAPDPLSAAGRTVTQDSGLAGEAINGSIHRVRQ